MKMSKQAGTHRTKNPFRLSLIMLLCCVLLGGMMFAFAACEKNDVNAYASFTEAKAAAAEQNKPILLYISKKPCPNCNTFKPKWIELKELYADKVVFHTTTINVDSEAADLFAFYNTLGDNKISGAPSVVWINASGEYVQKKEGGNTCYNEMKTTLENGLENWWSPAE